MKRSRRILVVEDEAPIRALIVTVLTKRDHEVDTAENGAGAVVSMEAGRVRRRDPRPHAAHDERP
jgi:CheY-like chemotaxis protein